MSRISQILNKTEDKRPTIHIRTAPAVCQSRVAQILGLSRPLAPLTIRQTEKMAEEQKKEDSVKQGKEYVNNPPHYHSKCTDEEMKAIIDRINVRGYIEAIDVIDAFFKDNFNLGSAFRYEARLGAKDDEITELDKAIWYLQHEKTLRQSRK